MSERFIRVFGSWLLALALVVTAAPEVAAQSGYQIHPGDTLNVEVLEDSGLNRSALVLPDGTISFPLVGTVQTSGRTVADLQQTLAKGLASNFAVEPNVFVSVNALAAKEVSNSTPRPPKTINVYIMGEIAKPGKFEVAPGTTILQILAQAGGTTKFAANKRIELRRTNPAADSMATYLFSYSSRSKGARISGSTALMQGDVVVVPQRHLFE
jgi:polysaccharide export outer membrane protein